MRKIILAILIFCSFSYIKAQTEHLRFNDVPINGNIFEFESKLDENYTQIFVTQDSSAIVLKGAYGNIPNCEIFVIGSEVSKNTYAIYVNLPESNKWNEILKTYKSIEDSFNQIYGEPFSKIANNYVVTDENIESLFMLNIGINKYQTIWKLPNGTISIEIGGKAGKNLKRDFLYSRTFNINDYNLNCYIILYFIDEKNKYLRDRQYQIRCT